MTYDDMFFKQSLKSIKFIEKINLIILIIFHNVIFKFEYDGNENTRTLWFSKKRRSLKIVKLCKW